MTATMKPVQSTGAPETAQTHRFDGAPFPRIEDYAFLSNCHTGALIARDGSVEWLCVPSFDSPSIFGSMLDREAATGRHLGNFPQAFPT